MDLQHINAKLFVQDPGGVDLEPVIPVFHSWIQDGALAEILIDVADYRHVPAGPGVVLVGHEANYSVDNTGNRLGVRYNRKAPLDGSPQDRLEQATQAALRAMQLLESDPRLAGKIRFGGRDLEISVNDRMVAPNGEATLEALDPEIRKFCSRLFAGKEFALEYDLEPRRLFSVAVKSAAPFTTDTLLVNLLSS